MTPPRRATDRTDGDDPTESRRAADDTESAPAPAAVPTPTPSGFHASGQTRHHVEAHPEGKRLAILSLTALGIVYGDIGTSPLYAIQQCFTAKEFSIAPTQENIYGLMSLIVWLLVLVVAVKYIVFIMRADNRGEGGTLALMALILQKQRRNSDSRRRWVLIVLGLFGAALLYGDGVITPAISVLSAMEALELAFPTLEHIIVPLALLILLGVFTLQRFGTARVGVLFGPIMALWFVAIAVLGLNQIVRYPGIVAALSPHYGFKFVLANGHIAFLALGAVVLAVTGAEALYADMGHFGKRPIRVAWFSMVLPALVLNYLGQGALLLREPAAASNPFFLLAPRPLLVPLIVLATLAAVIASQALISGAFSLTQQAVQLGYSPRVTVIHTSADEKGQIYIPEINRLLMIGCLVLVAWFKSSLALGAAYGIAVTGTMTITTILFYVVARHRWQWPLARILPVTVVFLAIDLTLLSANVLKIGSGGWVPIALAAGIFTLMSTWKKGRGLLHQALHSGALPLDLFLGDVARRKPHRVQGTAVFMTSRNDGVPVVLLHHLKHNKVLHEQVILMSVITQGVPETKDEERMTVVELPHGFYQITARYGFMEEPNIPLVLQWAREFGVKSKPGDTSYFLGRERIVLADGEVREGARRAPGGDRPVRMARWRKKIFMVMSRNARSATEFFGIPPNRVVELGAQVEL